MEPNQEPASGPFDPGISQKPASAEGSATPPPPPFTPASNDVSGPAQPEPQAAQPPASGTQPPASPLQPAGPAPVVGTGGMSTVPSGQPFIPSDPTVSAPQTPSRRFKIGRLPAILIALVVVLLGGAAAFWFGYYNNPSVIYSQGLSNAGKGYDRLLEYADKNAGEYDKGYSGSGTYKIKAPGFSTDGNIDYKTDGDNTELKFDFGAATTRIQTDIRAIKSSGSTPDIYVKADGIKGLGTMFGMKELDAELAKLNDQWIVIDHTFIDSLSAAGVGDTDSSPDDTAPTREEVLDEARAFGRVNKEYVFTTDKDKAVTKVVKKIGSEKVDGHSTYHYKVALNKSNVKDYLRAQKNALKDSKLNDWLKDNGYDKMIEDSFDSAIESADDIDESDTFDVWMDKNQRVLYKVRVSDKDNPASNYVDIGLDYKGGNDYPIFFTGQSEEDGQTATFTFRIDLNTDTGKTGIKLDYAAGGRGTDKSEFNSEFNLQPNDGELKIEKPEKAMSINEVLSGLDSAYLMGAGASQGADMQPITGPAKPSNGGASSGSNTGGVTLFRELLQR